MNVISIFGSANPEPKSADYVLAETVGRLLGEAGFAVQTGGYMGTMEGASKGGYEAAAEVIGITCSAIEKFRPVGPNPYVKTELRYETLRERLLHVVTHNDGMLVLPGGIGTLAELAMGWNGVQTGELSPRPLVLLGDVWSEMLPVFIRDQYVKPEHAQLLKIVNTPAEAVEFLVSQIDAERPKQNSVTPPIFLKLGGSLLTDKTGFEQIREDVLQRVASEIAAARHANPQLRLVLGHGSGSFGHTHASQHGTRTGVSTANGWAGFAAVSDSALRLNRIVVKALLQAGVPAVSLSPSASAVVEDGRVKYLATEPITAALNAGLVPVIHGDVAFDQVRGGTILSTEEVMGYLVGRLKPSSILLAGETRGVYDTAGEVIGRITPQNFDQIKAALGGSRGADVTGGMAAKVQDVLDLAVAQPGMQVRIFGGLEPGVIENLLINQNPSLGTVVEAA